jgi:hypothetical protein
MLEAADGTMALRGWHTSTPFAEELWCGVEGLFDEPANDDEEEKKAEVKKTDVTCGLVGFPTLMDVQEHGQPYLFEALLNADIPEIRTSPCFEAVVEYKWEKFGKKEWMKQVYVAMVFNACFVVGMTLFHDDNYSDALGIAIYSIAWLINFWYILGEYTNLVRDIFEHPLQMFDFISDHFSDFWNKLDLVMYSSTFFGGGLILMNVVEKWLYGSVEHEWYIYFNAVNSALMINQLMKLARGHKALGQLVSLIIDIVIDMAPFTSLVMVAAFGNGFALYLLADKEDEDMMGWFGSVSSMIYSSYCLILGTFEDGGMYDLANSVPYFLIFVFFTFFVDIVLLNALIALMGATYARVEETAAAETSAQRAGLIIEIQDGLTDAENEDPHLFPRWLHVIKQSEQESDEVNPIADAVAELQKGQDALHEKVEAMAASMEKMEHSQIAGQLASLTTMLASMALPVTGADAGQADRRTPTAALEPQTSLVEMFGKLEKKIDNLASNSPPSMLSADDKRGSSSAVAPPPHEHAPKPKTRASLLTPRGSRK